MRTSPERRLALLLLAALCSGPALAQPCADKHWVAEPIVALGASSGDGIGGSGRSESDQGIGGSGRSGDDSGIGGTGHGGSGIGGTGAIAAGGNGGIGGTGIVGVVAGFGSICVNGQEVHYERATPTSVDGLPARATEIGLGQMVSLRAASLGNGEYRAAEIALLNAVSGPVEALDMAAGTLTILGQSVRLPAAALARVSRGEALTISGNRLADGSILATRVMRKTQLAGVSLSGPVSALGPQGFRIGSLEVRLAGPAQLAEGEEVLVRGRLENGLLLADALQTHPRTAFVAPVRQLLLQGYVRPAAAGQLNVDGTLLSLAPGLAGGVPGSRLEVRARVEADGRMVAERLGLERPAAETRPGRPAPNEPAPGGKPAGAEVGLGGEVAGSSAMSGDGARPANLEPARAPVSRPDVTRVEVLKPEVVKPEVVKPEVVKPEIVKPEIVRPEVLRPEVVRPEILRPDLPGRGR